MIGFTVKLTPPQYDFVEEQKEPLDVPYGADVVRHVIEGLRTCFGLPMYQAELLERDMHARGLHWVSYVQELLARRYELLRDEAARHAAADRAPARSGPDPLSVNGVALADRRSRDLLPRGAAGRGG